MMLDNRETFLTKKTKNESCTLYNVFFVLSCINDTDFLLAQLMIAVSTKQEKIICKFKSVFEYHPPSHRIQK